MVSPEPKHEWQKIIDGRVCTWCRVVQLEPAFDETVPCKRPQTK